VSEHLPLNLLFRLICPLGAGTGGATKMVFEKIGHAFKSWTFTDISTGFFEKAAEVFAEHRDQMIFKALDCEKDIESQGYVKHSYDMVVASLVLHATESLEHTLKNVRELLKPGGFLVMLEMSPSGPIRFGFCMSGLPGWWLGQKDGRKFSPLADPTRWDTALKASGFAGVDAVTSDTDLFERPCFVLASQAVDDRVEVLRNPLSTPASLHPQEVILLGGAQTEVKGLVSHSRHLLESCGIKATEVKDFRDLLNIEIAPNTAVLSLTELDKPIFQEPTHDTIEGLKKLLSESKTILWVTRGRRAQEPYMNMTLGFSRTMALELPLLTTQFFDVDQKGLQPQMVVESLLRLNNLEHFQADSSQSPILWSQEPELDYKDGSVIVPRLRHMDAANQRYNSFKRAIKANKNQQLERIELISTPKGHVPVESAILARKDTKPSHVHIQVSYSSSHAVRVRSTAYYFVIYGTEVKSGIRYVGLSTKNCSVVEVADRMTVALDIPTGHEAFFIQSVVAELLADFITSLCAPHQVLHLHEPAPVVTSAVQQWGQKRQLTISFSTSDRARQSDLVSYIHPRATKLAFRSVLPQRTSCLADFSRGDQATLAASMSNALSSTCLRLGTDDFLSSEIDFTSGQHASGVEELLRISVSNSKQKPFVKGTEVIELHEIESLDSKVDPLSIVDWLSTARVAASIQPIDSAQLFSSEKTYVLFGLTSDLAQSLCYWMVEHGASHIVMTSRSPKVEEQWLQKLRGMGATIKIYAKYEAF
jgi:hybrid polyketide synthase/nonribosomal peptide synthetase ACE1